MNTQTAPTAQSKARFDWREDLAKSRDLSKREIDAYGYVLGWIESWRIAKDLPAGRDAARRWWVEVAKTKQRPEWQLRQWEEAIRWFLGWLEICEKAGGDARTIGERLKEAVNHAGARRIQFVWEIVFGRSVWKTFMSAGARVHAGGLGNRSTEPVDKVARGPSG